MDHAALGSPVQLTGCQAGRIARAFHVAFSNRRLRFLDVCSGATSNHAIAHAAFLILPVAFDLRLYVCQNSPPKLLVANNTG